MERKVVKQHISIKQFKELDDDQFAKLSAWGNENGYKYKDKDIGAGCSTIEQRDLLLSIGEMIQFLSEKGSMNISLWDEGWHLVYEADKSAKKPVKELCNILWEAVKDAL